MALLGLPLIFRTRTFVLPQLDHIPLKHLITGDYRLYEYTFVIKQALLVITVIKQCHNKIIQIL